MNDEYINEETAEEELKKNYSKAEELLNDEDKLEKFLQRLENKLKVVPLAGEKLADIPILVSLVWAYTKKEYTEIPIGSIIAVIAALIYFLSPIDLIPDVVPIAGYIDDAAIIAACLVLVDSDVQEYARWCERNGKKIDY